MGLLTNWVEDKRRKKQAEFELLKNLMKTYEFNTPEVQNMVKSAGTGKLYETIPTERKVPMQGPLLEGQTEYPYQSEPIPLRKKQVQDEEDRPLYEQTGTNPDGSGIYKRIDLEDVDKAWQVRRSAPQNQPKTKADEPPKPVKATDQDKRRRAKYEKVLGALKSGFYRNTNDEIKDIESQREAVSLANAAEFDITQYPELKALVGKFPKEKPGAIEKTKEFFRDIFKDEDSGEREEETETVPSFDEPEAAEQALKSGKIKKGQKVRIGGRLAIAN